MTTDDPWDGILDADERILWQGRPDGALSLGAGRIALVLFGLVFAGFALVWMILAAQAPGGFWMFGLIHFSVGLGIVGFALGGDAYRRRHSWYTLTDRRAFIATDLPVQGRRLKSWPIGADTPLELIDAPLATVHFATRTRRSKRRSYQVPVGFERIPDGRAVYRMMRDIQSRARATRKGQTP